MFILVSRRTNALSVAPFPFCPTFLLPISAYTHRFDLFGFIISMWLSLLSPRFQASGSYLWSLLCIRPPYVTSVSHACKTWLFTFTATIVTHLHSKHRVNVSALLLKSVHSLLILIVLIIFDFFAELDLSRERNAEIQSRLNAHDGFM